MVNLIYLVSSPDTKSFIFFSKSGGHAHEKFGLGMKLDLAEKMGGGEGGVACTCTGTKKLFILT